MISYAEHLLSRNSKKFPDDLFLKNDDIELTYKNAEKQVSNLANYLIDFFSKSFSVRKSQKVKTISFYLSPGLLYVLLILAIDRLRIFGITLRILPLNSYKSLKILVEEMNRVNSDILIHDLSPARKYSFQKIWSHKNHSPIFFIQIKKFLIALSSCTTQHAFHSSTVLKDIKENRVGETPMGYLFTSGSSGYSKVATFSWSNWIKSSQSGDRFFPFRRGDRWLHLLPFYHVSGFSIIARALLHGGAIVFTKKYRKNWEDCINRYRITHLSLVPTQLIGKSNASVFLNSRHFKSRLKKFSSLKLILLGGGQTPSFLHAGLFPRSPLRPTYGLTETIAHIATYDGTHPLKKNKKIGSSIPLKILSGKKIKIVNDEVCIHKDNLFMGYWKGGQVKQPWDSKGWFATGDIGVKYKNYLYIRGRKDRQFISGGENIYPEEIERLLLSYSNQINRSKWGISWACVFPVPHDSWGMLPAAILECKSIENQHISYISLRKLNSLKSFLAQHLESYKLPKYFFRLPKSLHQQLIGFKFSFPEIIKAYHHNQLIPLNQSPKKSNN